MDYSGIVDEIVVQCCTHFKAPVITQVQHVPFVGLAPVLVPVSPGTGDDRLPVPVIAGLGVLADTIRVQAHIVHHVVDWLGAKPITKIGLHTHPPPTRNSSS